MKIPEYLSRSNRVVALLVCMLFSTGVLISDYQSTKDGNDFGTIDIFDEVYDDFIYIFFYEKSVQKSWSIDNDRKVRVFGSYDEFFKKHFNNHRERYLSDKIVKFFFFDLFFIYCILFFLFYPKSHPFVLDKSRGVIYTVRRGRVYLYKVGQVEEMQTGLKQDNGEPLIISKEMGCANIWLKSIKTGKTKKFYMGYYPPSRFMSTAIEANVQRALMNSYFYPADKVMDPEDNLKPLRWFFELSLYPYFLHKKFDDPKYLQQIDAYLAGLDADYHAF